MMLHPIPASEVRDHRPILIVDDEPDLRRLFTRVLRDAGYETLEADDGVNALKLLEEREVSLVLLDSSMPRLDGPGVLRALRARDATRTLPVILVTGQADLEDRVRGLEAGADDYLAKPVALDELVARVEAQLRSHAALTDVFEQATKERRRLTGVLRRVRPDRSPEVVAQSFVAELVPALGLDSIAVLTFAADGAATPLAVGGNVRLQIRAGVPLQQAEGMRLRERAAQGPWLEAGSAARQRGRAGEHSDLAYVPLPGADAPLGLLVLGLPAAIDRPSVALSGRLALFSELAEMIAAVLGPGLDADATHREDRLAIERLIDSGAFTPFFQPIVDLGTGAVVGYEAMTRFADGQRADLAFAAAAQAGLGVELEAAAITAAIEAATAALPPVAYLSLNVSRDMVRSDHLGPLLAGQIRPIILEITEHVAIDDYAALRRELSAFGPTVGVAVDDAGAGYASLRHILELAPQAVKLDIGLVRGIDADPARQALIAGMSYFAVKRKIQLVAEGVETQKELGTLRSLGVHFGQGYLLGRPQDGRGPGPWPTRVALQGLQDIL